MAGVNARNSVSLARDQQLLAELNNLGLRAKNMAAVVAQVQVLAQGDDVVSLTVTDTRDAYSIVNADTGRIVQKRPAREPRQWRVTMARTESGWLMQEVV